MVIIEFSPCRIETTGPSTTMHQARGISKFGQSNSVNSLFLYGPQSEIKLAQPAAAGALPEQLNKPWPAHIESNFHKPRQRGDMGAYRGLGFYTVAGVSASASASAAAAWPRVSSAPASPYGTVGAAQCSRFPWGDGSPSLPPSLPELRPVRLSYQPPASSTFLSEQTSHQQPASSTLLSEQISTSYQPPANRTGC
jgi:hypothetical protein